MQSVVYILWVYFIGQVYSQGHSSRLSHERCKSHTPLKCKIPCVGPMTKFSDRLVTSAYITSNLTRSLLSPNTI